MRTPLIAMLIAGTAAHAAAQERPFLFSIATATAQKPAVRFDYDVGVGERAFQSDVANQPEQRVGVQASYRRLTMLGRVGIAEVGSSYQSSQSGEVLYSLLGASNPTSLAAGGGMLHEPDGVNVWLGRIVAGRNADTWLLHGNLLFQKPMAENRDTVDLITSVGWAHKLPHAMSLGVEAIGEDLEGFWDPEEAEGGARLLVGPSLRIAPANRSWQFSIAGGPVVHSTQSPRVSTAIRALPSSDGRNGYAVRTLLSYTF